jgi:hypothetical protein
MDKQQVFHILGVCLHSCLKLPGMKISNIKFHENHVDGQSDKHDKPNTILAFQNFGNV